MKRRQVLIKKNPRNAWICIIQNIEYKINNIKML
jgi:hypothetical protein